MGQGGCLNSYPSQQSICLIGAAALQVGILGGPRDTAAQGAPAVPRSVHRHYLDATLTDTCKSSLEIVPTDTEIVT